MEKKNDNFKIEVGDVTLNLKGRRMIVVERAGRRWHFTHPLEPLRKGLDRGTLRPHFSRRSRGGSTRRAFDRFTMALINVTGRAWPRAAKYTPDQLAVAVNRIGKTLVRHHWSRLERVDEEWVLEHALRLLVPDKNQVESFIDRALAARKLRLAESDAARLESVLPGWLHEPGDGLALIRDLITDQKSKFLLAGVRLPVEDGEEWASLHVGLSDDGELVLHVSPRETFTQEEFAEAVLEHVGPKLFIGLELVCRVLGIEYDAEKVQRLRRGDLH